MNDSIEASSKSLADDNTKIGSDTGSNGRSAGDASAFSRPAPPVRAFSVNDRLSPFPERPEIKRSSSTYTSGSNNSDALYGLATSVFLPQVLSQTVQMQLDLLRCMVPSKILDSSSREGLSASAVQVPVASISALLEAVQTMDWVLRRDETRNVQNEASSAGDNTIPAISDPGERDINVFELLQKVTDIVSGIAAPKGIDLVLGFDPASHDKSDTLDVRNMIETNVWCQPDYVRFILMMCLAKIVNAAAPQSAIELDLEIKQGAGVIPRPGGLPDLRSDELILTITLSPPSPQDIESEQRDALSDGLTIALLDTMNVRSSVESRTTIQTVPSAKDEPPKTQSSLTYQLTFAVGEAASSESLGTAQKCRSEVEGPSLDDLTSFVSQLKGQRIAFHGNAVSPFVRRTTKLLKALGCDVMHVAPETGEAPAASVLDPGSSQTVRTAVALTRGRPALVSYTSDLDGRRSTSQVNSEGGLPNPPFASSGPSQPDTAVLDPVTGVPVTFSNPQNPAATAADARGPDGKLVVPFNFVMIDDDVVTLQRELLRIRSAVPMLKSALSSALALSAGDASGERPPLQHRTKSSPQIERVLAQHPEAASTASNLLTQQESSMSQVIIFFTSVRSYRVVKDAVQPIIDSARYSGAPPPPEVMVLPKPAGLRRLLTALYAAEHKPFVETPFTPIATSPLSPTFVRARSWWSGDGQTDGDTGIGQAREFDSGTLSAAWSPVQSGRSSELASPLPPTGKDPLSPMLKNLSLTDDNAVQPAKSRNESVVQEHSTAASSTALHSSHARTSSRKHDAKDSETGATSGSGPRSKINRPETDPKPPTSSALPSGNSSHSRGLTPNTPLPADALEYFSETAAKMGGSGASGMMIQSSDGRPAGIFFQPKSSSSISSYAGSTTGSARRVPTGSITSPQPREPGSSSYVQGDTSTGYLPNRKPSDEAKESRWANSQTVGNSDAGGVVEQAMRISQVNPSSAGSRPRAPSGRSSRHESSASSGSSRMFAPQVGIQSVLSGEQPPVATPLVQNAPRKGDEADPAHWDQASRDDMLSASNGSVQSSKPTGVIGTSSLQADEANGKDGAASMPANQAGSPTTVASPQIKVATATPPPKVRTTGPSSVPPSPVAGQGQLGLTNKLTARQSFAAAPSPSDTKRPSAKPQSGFMMGMGFAPTARRGTYPKKLPVHETVLPPIKVLIVEDNPINQRILSQFMSRKKIKFDVANNGREAVEKWKTGGFHLILMDIQLPVMDGIEATKEIRKLERSANIGILPNTPPLASSAPFRAQVIIVALTASVLSSDRVEALAAGCNDFLNKPVNHPWLNQKILEWGSMMYLMYSGLAQEDKAQVHIGFGYGPSEKAKALASNLHMGSAALGKKKKKAAAAAAVAVTTGAPVPLPSSTGEATTSNKTASSAPDP